MYTRLTASPLLWRTTAWAVTKFDVRKKLYTVSSALPRQSPADCSFFWKEADLHLYALRMRTGCQNTSHSNHIVKNGGFGWRESEDGRTLYMPKTRSEVDYDQINSR